MILFNGAIPHTHIKKGMIKFKALPQSFLLQYQKRPSRMVKSCVQRGWLPEMPCSVSLKLALWESCFLLRTPRCEDGYPYPRIGEQSCYWQAQLRQGRGSGSAIGGSSSCLNCQSLFRIKAVINTATIQCATHSFCSSM